MWMPMVVFTWLVEALQMDVCLGAGYYSIKVSTDYPKIPGSGWIGFAGNTWLLLPFFFCWSI
jgi:hypothetical protein